jgi:hypothetical protein
MRDFYRGCVLIYPFLCTYQATAYLFLSKSTEYIHMTNSLYNPQSISHPPPQTISAVPETGSTPITCQSMTPTIHDHHKRRPRPKLSSQDQRRPRSDAPTSISISIMPGPRLRVTSLPNHSSAHRKFARAVWATSNYKVTRLNTRLSRA